MIISAIFPGQGSQRIGMAKELYNKYELVKSLFNIADDTLGFSITDIIFNGTEDDLKQTKYAQPALLLVSYAYYKVLEENKGYSPSLLAGHSLGEYSALIAAKSFAFADAIKLVHSRGTLMGETAEKHPGTMAAVLGASDDEVLKLCEQSTSRNDIVVPANYNSNGQTVVSGTLSGINNLKILAKESGKKVLPLPVSGAFHSPLMQEAADKFAEKLDKVEITAPKIMVIQNITAQETLYPDQIKQNLKDQITGSVQWVKTLQRMDALGVKEYLEIGPGNVLSGLVSRTIDLTDGKTVQTITELGY